MLKPETIIFLSKKSYWTFKANEPNGLKDVYVDTCAWWNRDNGKHGREGFKEIIKERVTGALL